MQDGDAKGAVVRALRDYMSQKAYDRDRFAAKVHLSRSTIDKMLVGIYSDRALAQVEKNTGMHFGPRTSLVEHASTELGSYSRDDASFYVGRYILARLSHSEPDQIDLSPFEILWDAGKPGLALQCKLPGIGDDVQKGYLSMPRSSAQIFVMSNDGGWARLMILSQPDQSRAMRGVLLTVGDIMGGSYLPVLVPVVLRGVNENEQPKLGPVRQGDPEYDCYRSELLLVKARQYVRILGL